jgi:hypothetical protein
MKFSKKSLGAGCGTRGCGTIVDGEFFVYCNECYKKLGGEFK